MTKEELAAKLNGRQYRSEITNAEAAEAKANSLVVIFGASDDLCELRGAIDEEIDCCGGGAAVFTRGGVILHPIERCDAETLERYGVLEAAKQARAEAINVTIHWCATPEWEWAYETTEPHATFDIMEGDSGYCRGIVVDLNAGAK